MGEGKTILFGGSGFLGPHILEKYPNIISVGRSLPPPEAKNKHINLPNLDDLSVLDSIAFDKVIFVIGNSNHHIINTKPIMGLEYNVTPLKKVLYYMQNRNLKKFIAFSTILLYDVNKLRLPVDESQPINPYVNDYVFSKFLAEQVCEFYNNKVPVINVRLSNIYGACRLIRPDIVPTIMQNVLSSNKPAIWNVKTQRDFIYVKDAADAIVKLLDTNYTGTVNLGSGSMNSVEHLVNIVENLSGVKIQFSNKDVTGPMKFCTDISLVNKLTGWTPKYSIEDGLKETYETMKKYASELGWV